MVEVIITVGGDIKLSVKGIYSRGEEETNIANTFTTFQCKLLDDEQLDELMEWCSLQKKDLWEVIEETVLEKLQ